MTHTVNGSWNGWQGDTIVELTDGSVWKQAEYLYEYVYSYRPRAHFEGNKVMVQGMSRAVQVRQLN